MKLKINFNSNKNASGEERRTRRGYRFFENS